MSYPMKALLLCATTVAAAVVSSRVLPTSEVLDTQSWSGSIMSGLLLVGIVSFCCSSLLPCCRSQRQQISACPNHCFHCRGWNGLYLGAEVRQRQLTRLHARHASSIYLWIRHELLIVLDLHTCPYTLTFKLIFHEVKRFCRFFLSTLSAPLLAYDSHFSPCVL